MIVHSLKDLPTTLDDQFEIGAILERDSALDAFVLRKSLKGKYHSLKDLPKNFRIGTSSLRRVAQLKRSHPHLEFSVIRGNLNTRFRKLDEDDLYDAIILAEAGIKRMNQQARISFVLKPVEDSCFYAVGQGALAVEMRRGDEAVAEMLAPLNHERTVLCCLAERVFLKHLEGGCSTPIGVHSSLEDEYSTECHLRLSGRVLSLDGSQSILSKRECVLSSESGPGGHGDVKRSRVDFDLAALHPSLIANSAKLFEASSLGASLAQDLLKLGAKTLLEECKALINEEVAKESSLIANETSDKNICCNQTLVTK